MADLTPEEIQRYTFKRVDIGEGFVEVTLRMRSNELAPELLYGEDAIQRIHVHVLGAAAGLCRAAGVDADLVLQGVLIALGAATKSGTCRVCGCTDQRACFGGCCWVNEEHTLCSACAGQ